jgi:hypothetical protein
MTTVEQIAERAGRLDPARQRQALEYIEWLTGSERRQVALAQLRRSRAEIVASGEPLLDLTAINAEVTARRGEQPAP